LLTSKSIARAVASVSFARTRLVLPLSLTGFELRTRRAPEPYPRPAAAVDRLRLQGPQTLDAEKFLSSLRTILSTEADTHNSLIKFAEY
jgi:hypothetical protein